MKQIEETFFHEIEHSIIFLTKAEWNSPYHPEYFTKAYMKEVNAYRSYYGIRR